MSCAATLCGRVTFGKEEAAALAVVVTVAKGYDLGYIWKTQGQASAERTSGGYYIVAAQAGEPPGRWWGPGTQALGFAVRQIVERAPYASAVATVARHVSRIAAALYLPRRTMAHRYPFTRLSKLFVPGTSLRKPQAATGSAHGSLKIRAARAGPRDTWVTSAGHQEACDAGRDLRICEAGGSGVPATLGSPAHASRRVLWRSRRNRPKRKR